MKLRYTACFQQGVQAPACPAAELMMGEEKSHNLGCRTTFAPSLSFPGHLLHLPVQRGAKAAPPAPACFGSLPSGDSPGWGACGWARWMHASTWKAQT